MLSSARLIRLIQSTLLCFALWGGFPSNSALALDGDNMFARAVAPEGGYDASGYFTLAKNPAAPTVVLAFSMDCLHCIRLAIDRWPKLLQLAEEGRLNVKLLPVRYQFEVDIEGDGQKVRFHDRVIAAASCRDNSAVMRNLIALSRKLENKFGEKFDDRRRRSGWVDDYLAAKYLPVLESMRSEIGADGGEMGCKGYDRLSHRRMLLASAKELRRLKIEGLPAIYYKDVLYKGGDKILTLGGEIQNETSISKGIDKIEADAAQLPVFVKTDASVMGAKSKKQADSSLDACQFVRAVKSIFQKASEAPDSPSFKDGMVRELNASVLGSNACVFRSHKNAMSRYSITCEWDESRFTGGADKSKLSTELISKIAACTPGGGGDGNDFGGVYEVDSVIFMADSKSKPFRLLVMSDGVKEKVSPATRAEAPSKPAESAQSEDEYAEVLRAIEKPIVRTYSTKEQLFMAGLSAHFHGACGYPASAESRQILQKFLSSSAFVGAVGRKYGARNLGEGLMDQAQSMAAHAAGQHAAQRIGCSALGKRMTDNVVSYLKTTSGANGSAAPFVSGCVDYYSGRYNKRQCQCIADIGRAVIPNIHQTPFTPGTIKSIIQGNPFVGLQVGFKCGIGDY